MPPHKFSPTQEKEICERYQEGESLASLGRSYGAAVSTVALTLERYGIGRRPAKCPVGAQRIFSPAQEAEIVRRYRAGESAPRLARGYGVDASTVCDALRRHGVKMRGNVLQFTEAQIAELARRYRGGATLRELAAELGADKKTVGRRLKEHGVAIRSAAEASRRLDCDYGFFDAIDTEAKAYWLGFLAADGNISGNLLQVTLSIRDRDHLERFRCDLGSTHAISEVKGRTAGSAGLVRFAIMSQQLCAGLAKHGIHPKKTFTVRWPDFLSDDLLRHYLRGLVDGDGGWYAYPSKKGGGRRMTLSFQLTSNEAVCREAQDYLVRMARASRTKLIQDGHHDSRTVTLKYGGNKRVGPIYHLLYDGATVYLPRKHEAIRPHVHLFTDLGLELVKVDSDELKKLRKDQGMTAKELSAKAGVSTWALSRIETDKGPVRFSTILKLAAALGVGPTSLLYGTA